MIVPGTLLRVHTGLVSVWNAPLDDRLNAFGNIIGSSTGRTQLGSVYVGESMILVCVPAVRAQSSSFEERFSVDWCYVVGPRGLNGWIRMRSIDDLCCWMQMP